jgi:hypothetical protein
MRSARSETAKVVVFAGAADSGSKTSSLQAHELAVCAALLLVGLLLREEQLSAALSVLD